MAIEPLVTANEQGLYCRLGNLYIDPWGAVDRAIITHAHGDHARAGSRRYLTARTGEHILRLRLGLEATIESMEFGERVTIGAVQVSLHPAGHILGSAQVRLESSGQVCVVSGDYQTTPTRTVEPFEQLRLRQGMSEKEWIGSGRVACGFGREQLPKESRAGLPPFHQRMPIAGVVSSASPMN